MNAVAFTYVYKCLGIIQFISHRLSLTRLRGKYLHCSSKNCVVALRGRVVLACTLSRSNMLWAVCCHCHKQNISGN
jgi:hypothetical protein